MPVRGVMDDTANLSVVVGGLQAAGVVSLAATALTVTADRHAGRVIVLNHTGAASTVTLPTATATGNTYRFVVGAVNTSNHVIRVPNAATIFAGNVITSQDSADTVVSFNTAADSDTITLNGTTTGGAAIGDFVEVIDIAANVFAIRGQLTGTGVEASPFSAAVS